MAYGGQSIPIPLGELGLRTDEASTSLPPNALIKANNVSLYSGRIEKVRGSTKFNSTALSGGIVCLFDYWPTTALQRLIAATSDGKIFRDTGDTTFTGGVAITSSLGTMTPDTHMSTAGQESAGRNRKLFIFPSGLSQIQVINGDASTTTAIALPSADWSTGNYPTFGLMYQNRMCVLGSAGNRHQLYFSTTSDHENFVGQNFVNARWELWSRIAATPNVDKTATIQAGSAVNIFTTTVNDGFITYGVNTFNKISFTISVASAIPGVTFTYNFWNGSAWTALTTTALPDYTTTGAKTIEFSIPSTWAVGDGTEGGGNNSYYAVRVLATVAAPTNAITITSMTVTNTNYDTTPPTFAVFPGESDGMLCAAVYRGLLFLFKEPFGVYILDGRSSDSTDWTISRYSDAFGVASPHAVLQILSDLTAANSFGSYTSLQASDAYGDFEAGDILSNNLVENYIRSIFNSAGIPFSQSIYYPEKKVAYFTGQTSSTDLRNQMLVLDVGRQQLRPSIDTKERPNCLALRRDSQLIQRPIAGDKDGFVFLLDQSTYNRNGVPYIGEFQTAYTDFSFANAEFAGKNKIFDFLEVNYVPTGNNNFYCDVYIDGEFRQTLSFYQNYGAVLGAFVLDEDTLAGDAAGARNRKPLKSCTGVRISFRFYNNSFNEAFKIERIVVGFRPSAEQMYSFQP